MGDPILTGVTLVRDSFGDPRFEYLAALCGLADADHARGKMARLWSVCTALESDTPPLSRIIVCLGPRGPEALIETDLGERAEGGLVRVKGCELHDWYKKQRHAAGGKARIATAARDPKTGQLQRASSGSPADRQRATSDHQQGPAQDQGSGSDPDPEIDPVGGVVEILGPRAPTLPAQRLRRTPTGDLIPDGWEPKPSTETADAERDAIAAGVVIAFARRKFVEKSRDRARTSHDWDAAYRTFLAVEWATPPQIRDAMTRKERAATAAAARDRERTERTENDRRAAADLESVRRAAKSALENNFRLPDGKATG